MENLFIKIKETSEREPPSNLKKDIMRKLLILKLKPYLLISFPLVVMSLSFITVQSYTNIIETGVLFVVKVFIQNFEISNDYLTAIFQGLTEVLPINQLILILINLICVIFMMNIFRRYRQIIFNFNF
ncbi:MAG: hypothetical protein NT091_03945 [Candidatus Falkowbacteria bacterium]|nr:hypothetical protein [Candidatus Falkowbacteria bacterium]